MEYEQDNQDQGGLIERIKESPRTVSALIIILIVAAAIFAFSGDQDQQEEVAIDQEAITTAEEAASPAAQTVEETAGALAPEPVEREVLAEQEQALPEATTTDEGYVEVAEAGDGITHLARRATTRYLNENTTDYAVTNEHRIYIEDYIKDRLGSRPLALGETQTVSFDLIGEAVAAAGQLNESQLRNLTQYTYVLT
jgi:hypothetical protein